VPDQAPKETKKRNNAFTALEIAEQVYAIRGWLVEGNSPALIRKYCSEQWGLSTRVADSRIMVARQEMVRDIQGIDRQQFAAQLVEAAAEILKDAKGSRQLSNALGALRLQAEILGVTGRSN
jgi:hypothetical protein